MTSLALSHKITTHFLNKAYSLPTLSPITRLIALKPSLTSPHSSITHNKAYSLKPISTSPHFSNLFPITFSICANSSIYMVNRSPTSNYQFRHCHIRIMAPTPTTVGQPRRAVADEPLRSAGHHPAAARDPNQRVNDRLAGLGEEATTRRSGGQGVDPSYYNNDNQFHFDNQYMSQPNFNSHMQYFPGNQSQGGVPLRAYEMHQLRQGPYW